MRQTDPEFQALLDSFLEDIEFKLEDMCFDKQLEFIQSTHRFKTACCSRRAGKTVADAAYLIHAALNKENVRCIYITLTRSNAKRIIWPELTAINRRFMLGGIVHETELSITFPNKSVIYITGAKDASEIEKFRGLPIFLCIIDECQSFRSHIQRLIDDVISKALFDYSGTLCLTGTPGPLPSGYFYDTCTSEQYAHFGWTFFENPYIEKKAGKTPQELLVEELTRKGVDVTDPTIQRECFGRWVLDSNALLVRYDATRNHYDEIGVSDNVLTYLMGIDLGYNDADAISILAWSEREPTTYLVEESVVSKQGISELVSEINRLDKKYKVSKMIVDEGGLGKKIAEELRRRHHIPVQPAEKQRKMENVAFLNDALRTGMFKAKKDSRFAQDSYLVEIDKDRTTPERIYVSDHYHSDIIDSVLYAFKESPAFTYLKPKELISKSSPQWSRDLQDDLFEKAMEHFEKEAELI